MKAIIIKKITMHLKVGVDILGEFEQKKGKGEIL